MADEQILTELAGPTSRQVGQLPCYDVRAWWTVRSERSEGRVKLAAGQELKKELPGAAHVEFVRMDLDTCNSPRMNATLTFRVLTEEQFARRAELRSRVYRKCDGDGCTEEPGQLVRMLDDSTERALCYACWRPLADAQRCKVLHWINRHGKLQV